MSQSKILIDANTYFRLANSIHPLLKVEFKKKHYCLYILKEIKDEYNNNPRLKSKFYWFEDEEYVKNRQCRITISKEDRFTIDKAINYIAKSAASNNLGVSLPDIKYIAHCYILKVPLVTDDKDMLTLAKLFSVTTYNTLELLKLMCECNHINRDLVKDIVDYWEVTNDKPANCDKDFKRLFLTK